MVSRRRQAELYFPPPERAGIDLIVARSAV
jgi:hypothetical protein